MSDEIKVTVTFNAADVEGIFNVTKDEAEAFLSRNGKVIEGRMRSMGYEVIEDLGITEGLTQPHGSRHIAFREKT